MSTTSFQGSIDPVFAYRKLSAVTWEAYMSSSLRNILRGWAYSVTGVVEGFWDVRFIPRTGIGVTDYFSQRPAL